MQLNCCQCRYRCDCGRAVATSIAKRARLLVDPECIRRKQTLWSIKGLPVRLRRQAGAGAGNGIVHNLTDRAALRVACLAMRHELQP